MINLESYLIPAMEAVNRGDFFKVFIENDYMNYNTETAKVNGRLYNTSDLRYLKDVMQVVINDKWSEADFIKFIEENIQPNDKSLEIYYWLEDDTTDPISDRDKKNRKLWNSLKLICVSEDGAGNVLFYSKSKHGFYFINHEKYLDENLKCFIKWKDAVDGFAKINLKHGAAMAYLTKLIGYYKIEDKCLLIEGNNDDIEFSLKTRREYDIENILIRIVSQFNRTYRNYRISKSIDYDKTYYNFYPNG